MLKVVPYTSGSAILKGLSPDLGQVSFFLRGMGGKKTKNQILTQAGAILSVEYTDRSGSDLLSLQSLERLVYYHNVPGDVVKSSLMLFLAEIILKSTQQNDGSEEMFALAKGTFEWIDLSEDLANVHLYFLAQWIRLLGLQPQAPEEGKVLFDLQEGAWLSNASAAVEGRVLNKIEAAQFLDTFQWKMSGINNYKMGSMARRNLLHALVNYLCFQLSIGKGITSLPIIELLFDEI